MDSVAPGWLSEWLPPESYPLVAWLLQPAVLITLVVFSSLLFVASTIGVPFFVIRLPADYFSRWEQQQLGIEAPRHPRWRLLARLARNLLGGLLVVAGLLMFVLPGQGILTLLAGLCLVSFPGKRRLQRRLISSPLLLRTINRLRRRAGRAPLLPAELSPPVSKR